MKNVVCFEMQSFMYIIFGSCMVFPVIAALQCVHTFLHVMFESCELAVQLADYHILYLERYYL